MLTIEMIYRGIEMRDFELENLAVTDIKAALMYIGKKVRYKNLFLATPATPDRQNTPLSINTHPRQTPLESTAPALMMYLSQSLGDTG